MTTLSLTSLTMTANDGTTHTYAIDDKTVIHARSGAQNALNQNDKVVVATMNSSSTATAVIAFNPDGFGPHGPR